MSDRDNEFSFKHFFIPLTTFKAIHWIIVVGLIVYFNVLFNGFLWDDLVYFIPNPAIHNFDLFSLFGVNQRFNGEGFYRPIPAIHLSLYWNLFGSTSFFYHLTQVVLHIMCSILFFVLLKRFFSIGLSFFLAMIFLLHPMQVESVAYISSTQNNLFFIFGIGALLISMKEILSPIQYATLSILLLLSLLSKETAFLFIPLILLYQLLFKRQRILAFIPYIVGTGLLYSLLRFVYAQSFFTKNLQIPIAMLSFPERLINMPAIFFYYIATFFYPLELTVDQQWIVRTTTFSQFYFPLIIDVVFLLLLFTIGIYLYKRRKKFIPLYIFSSTWFLLGIGLVMQFIPLDATVSDRWFYFPIAGLLILFGILYSTLHIKNIIMKLIIVTIAVLVLVLLSFRTFMRNTNYYDQFTLFSHDTAVAEKSFDLENQIAIMYYQKGNPAEARKHFEKSIALMPCSDALSNLAILDKEAGDLQAAAKNYQIVVDCRGSYGD